MLTKISLAALLAFSATAFAYAPLPECNPCVVHNYAPLPECNPCVVQNYAPLPECNPCIAHN
jgi:hypothetical protein